MKTILISSAGRRVELLNSFRKSAFDLGMDVKILAADLNPDWSPACQVADEALKVVRCTHPSFIQQMLDICEEQRVDLIIPTIDTELSIYAKAKAEFAKIGTRVMVADLTDIEIIRNKYLTAKTLEKARVPVPLTWLRDQKEQALAHLPLILKPIDGSLSEGIRIVNEAAELGEVPDNFILQELIKGDEYTVNVFVSSSGKFVCAVPHFRKFVRAGEVTLAETRRRESLTQAAKNIVSALPNLTGAFCFQAIENPDGNVKVFEINGRFGGGYPLAHQAGCPMSKWLLQEISGQRPDYHDHWQEHMRMLRYDAAVFI